MDRLQEADMKISYQYEKIAEKTRKIAELQSKARNKSSRLDMKMVDHQKRINTDYSRDDNYFDDASNNATIKSAEQNQR